MSERKGKTYRVRVNDCYSSEDEWRVVDLEGEYMTLDAAADAGWLVVTAIAQVFGLGYENQGDQYMAYYQGGEKEGIGAFTVQILDEAGVVQEIF